MPYGRRLLRIGRGLEPKVELMDWRKLHNKYRRARRRACNRRLVRYSVEEVLPARKPAGPKELMLVCSVMNGMLFLPSFLRHYRTLGVRHFVFAVDARSEDDTQEVLCMESDVTVLRFNEVDGVSPGPQAVREELLQRYAVGRWCLHVDIDEFFDFPHSDKVSLPHVLEYLGAQGYNAMFCLMLDRFADGDLRGQETDPEQDLSLQYPWYDLTGLRWEPYGRKFYRNAHKPHPLLRVPYGGIMNSCFESRPLLMKHPLIRFDPSMRMMTHYFQNMLVADVTGVLNHYRFVSDVRRRVGHFLSDGERHSLERYSELARRLEGDQPVLLKQPSSRRWRSVEDLVDQGVLLESEVYRDWVARCQERTSPA